MKYEIPEGILMVEILSTGVMLKLFGEDGKIQKILEIEDLVKLVKSKD